MPERTFLSVGYDIPGHSDCYLPFDSDRSLLDADVILFHPTLESFSIGSRYMGKRRLSDNDSVEAVEACRRWKQELTEVLKAGKTVVIFLSQLEEVFVHLGQRSVSGTGRSQKVTLLVESLTNYASLPIDLGSIVPKGGAEIRPAHDMKYIASYWAEFSSRSPYKVYFKGPTGTLLLTAKTPDAVVGIAATLGAGTVIALPPVSYSDEEFTRTNKKGDALWTREAVAFGDRLVSALMELDSTIRAGSDTTPAPTWVQDPQFAIPEQLRLETEILKLEGEIAALRGLRDELQVAASEAVLLRDLLFEAGKPLEGAIIRALTTMGYSAAPFKGDGSEFDVVFSSPEGQFIGEAEGRNDKPIGIAKLDQLERNIREDFARSANDVFAKGVLFGNASRLYPPSERAQWFTPKCIAAATRAKVALVRSPDLFIVARYLETVSDPAYASACRRAIIQADGSIVEFPLPPQQTSPAAA